MPSHLLGAQTPGDGRLTSNPPFVLPAADLVGVCEEARLFRSADLPVHEDLVKRQFMADRPDQPWLTGIERHEALSNRVEVGDLHRRAVAAAWL